MPREISRSLAELDTDRGPGRKGAQMIDLLAEGQDGVFKGNGLAVGHGAGQTVGSRRLQVGVDQRAAGPNQRAVTHLVLQIGIRTFSRHSTPAVGS